MKGNRSTLTQDEIEQNRENLGLAERLPTV